MTAWIRMATSLLVLSSSLIVSSPPPLAWAQSTDREVSDELETLRREVEELRRRDEANRRLIEDLGRRLDALDARPGTAAASGDRSSAAAKSEDPSTALDAALAEADTESSADVGRDGIGTDVWSRPFGSGGARLRLIDVSLDVMMAAGGSTAGDAQLQSLQGGKHDPRRNGFTLQQAELAFVGAVDPYFTGEAYISASTDEIELEEAFGTTTALPWGLQLEGGFFFTEFGRINPRHPHAWDWLDQPVVNTRMFGGEGLRSTGLRLGWLTPLSWPSELHFGIQNASEGEFTRSFVSDEPVGGRPELDSSISGPADLLYLARWTNAWDFSPTTTSVLGLSGLFGPNSAGDDTRTWIAGFDLKLRWRPQRSFRGWPFVTWQTEAMYRAYETDMVAPAAAGDDTLPAATLRDWGLYSQLLWGFRAQWAAGVRFEYDTGSGQSVEGSSLVSRNADADRDDRMRISPLLVWWPSHFSRLRLQYNYDDARHLNGGDAHTVWLGAEIFYGSHPAHDF